MSIAAAPWTLKQPERLARGAVAGLSAGGRAHPSCRRSASRGPLGGAAPLLSRAGRDLSPVPTPPPGRGGGRRWPGTRHRGGWSPGRRRWSPPRRRPSSTQLRAAARCSASAADRRRDGATLEWLPQETILFDGARLRGAHPDRARGRRELPGLGHAHLPGAARDRRALRRAGAAAGRYLDDSPRGPAAARGARPQGTSAAALPTPSTALSAASGDQHARRAGRTALMISRPRDRMPGAARGAVSLWTMCWLRRDSTTCWCALPRGDTDCAPLMSFARGLGRDAACPGCSAAPAHRASGRPDVSLCTRANWVRKPTMELTPREKDKLLLFTAAPAGGAAQGARASSSTTPRPWPSSARHPGGGARRQDGRGADGLRRAPC